MKRSGLTKKLFLTGSLITSGIVGSITTYLPMNSRYSTLQSQHQDLQEEYATMQEKEGNIKKECSRVYIDNIRLTEKCQAMTKQTDIFKGMTEVTQIFDDLLANEISILDL